MFFTKGARVLASLAVFLGAMRFAIGLYAAITDNQAIAARYLSAATTGEAMDEALMLLAAGLALGVLTDISRSVGR